MCSRLENISPNKLIYYGFKVAGSMNNDGKPWSLIYTVYLFSMINLTGITAVLAVLWGSGNLTELTLSISSFLVYTQMILKQLAVLTNQTNVRNFIKRLEHYRKIMSEDRERRNIVIEAEKFGIKFITLIVISFISFPFVSIIMNFTIDYLSNFEKPHLVLQLYVPWKMNDIWPYLAGNIFTAMASMSMISCYISFIIVQFLVTFQMSAYLRVLQDRIETNGPRDKYIYYHHKTIIQLIQDYNELFTGCLYQEALISSLNPCGYGYALLKAIKNNESGAFDLVYKTLMALSGPLIMSACGEEIHTQVEKLHESSYSCKWYEEKPKVRREIFTMMLVTTRPITVNYRLYVTLNMALFSKIIQGIYSYLTMIVNFE